MKKGRKLEQIYLRENKIEEILIDSYEVKIVFCKNFFLTSKLIIK